MRLHSFTVHGFRSLAHVEDIPVGKPTVLTGHNDGGKSATLAALGFLLGTYNLTKEDHTFLPGLASTSEGEEPPRRDVLTWVKGRFHPSAEEQAALGLSPEVLLRRSNSLTDGSRLEIMASLPEDPRLREPERQKVSDLLPLCNELAITPEDKRKPALVEAVLAYAASVPHVDEWVAAGAALTARLPELLAFAGNASDANETVRATLNSRYQAHLRDDSLQGKVTELEKALQDKLRGDAQALCDHIKERCPDLLDVSVEPDVSFKSGLGQTLLQLARTEGEPVGLQGSGAGRARRVALAVWEWNSRLVPAPRAESASPEDILPPPEVIVAYDEPDTHLDYAHQRRVMDLIRAQCAQANVQVLIATHSLNLIDGVDLADVVHLRLEEERTVLEFLRSDDDESLAGHLSEIAAALGVRNSVILYERCFVGVEGPSEQQAFPQLFRLATGLRLQSVGIALWACNGNEGALHFARYLASHGRRVALAVDRDSRTKPKSLFTDARLLQYGLDPESQVHFLGDPNEVEELFGDEQWAKAATALWPRKDGTPWSEAQFSAYRQSGKFSSQVLEMLKTESNEGPTTKPEALRGLVSTLEGPEDVPDQLRSLFGSLMELVAS